MSSIKNVIRRRHKTMIRKRPGTKTITAGRAQPATDVTTKIKAHVQPLSPKEIRDLPPGQNAIDWRNFWSYTDDLMIDDKIETGGVTYRLKNVIYWDEGEFWQAQGSKVSDTI